VSGPRLIVAPDAAALAEAGAAWLAERLAATARRAGRCTVALAGGNTPRPIYQRLAAPPLRDRLPWERILLLFGDERCVPPDDPAANYRMAREALAPVLASGGARPRLLRIEAERADPGTAAADYDAAVPAIIDVLVLGMGAEGHTASLFPGSPALAEEQRGYVAVRAPVPPVGRITLTPPRLGAAREILVVAAGADKAAAAQRALEGELDIVACPAQLARRGTWLLDDDAASQLSRQA